MGLCDPTADLFHQLNRRFDRHKLDTIRAPKLVQATTRHVFHREVTASATRCLEYVGVVNPHNVRMLEPRQQDRFAQRLVGFVQRHPHTLEHLHRLPSKEAMLDAIDLSKRPFAQEAFHFVGLANHPAFFQ